jgi:hypothetical protein
MESTSGGVNAGQGAPGQPAQGAQAVPAWITWQSQADEELRNQVIRQVVSRGDRVGASGIRRRRREYRL